jgi:RHS repeat-associated protein
LTQATALGGATTRYIYDGLNNRVRKTNDVGTTNFLVDPFGHRGTSLDVETSGCCDDALPLPPTVGLPQVLRETDGAGGALADYVYGDKLLISQRRGSGSGNLSFYLPDGQASTRLLADAVGAVTDTYEYDAFGDLMAQTGNSPNLYRYTGQQLDPGIGSYYLRARYYDPRVGRFNTRDPFTGFVSDPPSLHPYTYAYNNPVNHGDPTGRSSLLEGVIVGALVAVVGSVALSFKNNFLESLGSGVISVIDPTDFEGKYQSKVRVNVVYMTDVQSMVANVIAGVGDVPIRRLNIADHGNEEMVEFGLVRIYEKNFAAFEPRLSMLRGRFAPNGFVHLLACDIGSNLRMLVKFAKAFGAPVAAGSGVTSVIYNINSGDYKRCHPNGQCDTSWWRP